MRFARASGRLAKTDRIDAIVLAEFARALRPNVRALASDAERPLDSLVHRRRQVVVMIGSERQRLLMTKDAVLSSCLCKGLGRGA